MRHKLAKQVEAKRLQLALSGRSAITSPGLVSVMLGIGAVCLWQCGR